MKNGKHCNIEVQTTPASAQRGLGPYPGILDPIIA